MDYNVFMGVVQSAYPKHGWHLSNYLAYVLQAWALPGEMAATEYDEAFTKHTSHSQHTRWGSLNDKLRLVIVDPHMKKQPKSAIKWATSVRRASCLLGV